jgi:hypothetical protein
VLIRQRLAAGESGKALAEEYNVTGAAISYIKRPPALVGSPRAPSAAGCSRATRPRPSRLQGDRGSDSRG